MKREDCKILRKDDALKDMPFILLTAVNDKDDTVKPPRLGPVIFRVFLI